MLCIASSLREMIPILRTGVRCLSFALLAGAIVPTPDSLQGLLPLLSPDARVYMSTDGVPFQELVSRLSTFETPTAAAVVEVANEDDIVQTVAYARANNITFLPQNRGHGWDIELSRIQQALVINIEKLHEVTVDKIENTVTFGGGASVDNVTSALYSAGKQMNIPSCNCIGLLGAALGGGLGRLMGKYGMVSDQAVSYRLLLANGTLVEASDSINPDLFWAMRGAGHNFGIVTTAKFKVDDLPPGGDHYSIDMIFPPDQIENITTYLNDIASTQPAELSFNLIYTHTITEDKATPIIFVNMVYAGLEEAGRQLAATLLTMNATIANEAMIPWIDLPTDSALGAVPVFCEKGARNNMWGSAVKKYDPKTMKKLYNEYVDLVSTYPLVNQTDLLFQSHSQRAVKAINASTTAYPHREANVYVIEVLRYYDADLDDTMSDWGKRTRGMIRDGGGFSEPRVYLNYAHGDESLETKYGYEDWRLSRLKGLKAQYDPYGLFDAYHPIPTL